MVINDTPRQDSKTIQMCTEEDEEEQYFEEQDYVEKYILE